ncbi:OmpA/MotB domain-containing protein [Methylopila jiangsuensis]|uniref:OmpA/MotB domain-containing protein n=2 Tax=Methylopila jiangsuensis TaxID=586230 RepID=A0A9W6N3N5_9HYPH|nr:OmpA/MotB domain-containing protein [Methylopila jiangsuensis]
MRGAPGGHVMRFIRRLLLAIVLGALAGPALADTAAPTKDVKGAKDNPLLKRYEGSFIVSYERQAFTDFSIPLSKIEKNPDGERDAKLNNYVFRPAKKLDLEGARTRLVYVLPEDRSPLEALRNYQDEVEAAGGEVLFACKGADGCGGDSTRAASGGGGDMSFMMYFVTSEDLKDEAFSNGSCALNSGIGDQRFFAARLPTADGDAHVTVHTFQMHDTLYCKALNGRTIALVHVIEPKGRDRKMVTVKAEDMAKSIDKTGRVALYGVFFDTDKAELKPASEPTLKEIAALLKGDPKLAALIVGHTDNQGGFDYNMDLSKRRAEAVVKALAASHGVDPKRLRAAGAGMIAPAAPNDSEDGRAKNRRVEVVRLN